MNRWVQRTCLNALLVSLLSLAACDDGGVQVASNQDSSSNGGNINPGTTAVSPQNGLTFANGEQDSLTARVGLDQHLSSGISTAFEQLQDEIFGSKCALCHTGGDKELPGSMDFSNADATYSSLVSADSTEYPQLSLVAPGMSTNSYLIRKIEGTQLVGKQMPLQGGYLSSDEIRLVKAWVDGGALR